MPSRGLDFSLENAEASTEIQRALTRTCQRAILRNASPVMTTAAGDTESPRPQKQEANRYGAARCMPSHGLGF
jgi:hypothetical protein